MIITGSDPSLVNTIIRQLDSKFSTKDLEALSYLCGVEFLATSTGLLLSQQNYVIDLLTKHNLLGSKPVSTPLAIGILLTANDDTASVNATIYRQVVRGLQHLRMTRLDISFDVNKLSLFMHTPSTHHWGAVKRLLRYLNGTRSLDIRLLADTPLTLHGFSNEDWSRNPDDHTSTNAFLIFLSANPISWSSTKQRTVARSSTEAEYHVIAAAATELQWVKSLLSELLVLVQSPPTLFSYNLGATYLSANLAFHSRMKHLAINYHFVRGMVQSPKMRVIYAFVGDQLVDALTKYLSRPRLFSLCNKIGVIYGTPS